MIETRISPAFLIVTRLTFVAETTLVTCVLIIFFMTGHTFNRWFVLCQRSPLRQMTAVTLCLSVSPAKDIVRVGVMIKAQLIPATVGMTTFALHTIASAVAFFLIILLVTRIAFPGGLERLVVVTCLALDIGMLATERETGFPVLKCCVFPTIFIMALAAPFAKATLVPFLLIILSVTSDTIDRGFAILDRFSFVAAFALGLLMLSAQPEVALRMIKFFFDKLNDKGLASPVFAMAATTLRFLDPSMKASM